MREIRVLCPCGLLSRPTPWGSLRITLSTRARCNTCWKKELCDLLQALKGTCLKQRAGVEFLGDEGVLASSGEVTKMHRLKWSFEPVGFLGEDGRHRQK